MKARASEPSTQRADLRVEALATGGQGLVRAPDGRVVFASGVARGELVRIELDAARRGAKLLAILEPSPDRVSPSCPHVGRCGGCDWMHLSLPAQAREHSAIVHELLAHALGTLEGVALDSVAIEGALRSRARFAFRSTSGAPAPRSKATPRSRPATRPRTLFGYRARGGHDVVSVDRCEILEPGLLDTAREVSAWFGGADAEGELSVAFGLRGDERLPVVSIRLERGDIPASFAKAADEARHLAGVEVNSPNARAPMRFGDPRVVQPGMDGLPLFGPAGGFFQASDAGALALARYVCELVGPAPKIHELFAGSGTFSIGLAKLGALTSVELDAAAVACAKQNLAARGSKATLHSADAERVRLPAGVDVVVLDPPRTGAAGATSAICAAKPKRVVYVACDPATLARDAASLRAGGYRLGSVRTFELFPHTSHVETVALFMRGGGP